MGGGFPGQQESRIDPVPFKQTMRRESIVSFIRQLIEQKMLSEKASFSS